MSCGHSGCSVNAYGIYWVGQLLGAAFLIFILCFFIIEVISAPSRKFHSHGHHHTRKSGCSGEPRVDGVVHPGILGAALKTNPWRLCTPGVPEKLFKHQAGPPSSLLHLGLSAQMTRRLAFSLSVQGPLKWLLPNFFFLCFCAHSFPLGSPILSFLLAL